MNSTPHSPISGFLFDLDGVVYIDDNLIPGAAETIQFLKDQNFPCRFLTNTTVKSLGNLHKKILRLNLPIEKEEIISPPAAAVKYLRKQGDPTCRFFVMDETREDFAEFREAQDKPDYIVVGKIGDRWNYQLMNEMFGTIVGGSKLIALHKDRYTMGVNGLFIEFGAFIAGLEYATGQEALVIGKPSLAFFQSALESIGLTPEETVMVGDDLISDIHGAQNAGMRGFLVQTGKYKEELVAQSPIEPDRIIPSIATILEIVQNNGD